MPTKAEQTLIDVNAVISQFIPLIGVIGVGVRATLALLRESNPSAAQEFELEIAKYDAQRAKLGDAIADFKKKYPV